ncbi:NAD-dependent epimerase/dehydratase family protein [Flavobacterium johnsoniae]|jgi:uncharacterized protein YbjT (DUF2867 family)|uniref:NAD-dependent epimerase/dehydratase family protein n=1 Tax=Flavobacterium johnsoniae TaxID=986 RepID=UPI003D96ECAA
MKILLTGATGYIGKRLLPLLLDQGYEAVCCVRDKSTFFYPQKHAENIQLLEVDFFGSTERRENSR